MFGLSFLSPLFLLGALAVAIPIALHLFRQRTELVVDFPAVRLMRRMPVEQQRRRRLRELILLALRITALVLLAVAFARPYVSGGTAAMSAPVTVVALDTSLSLSAPGQFERAREAAQQAVEGAPATHSVALVTFADSATLVVPPTTDRGGVLAAIEQAQPGAGGTRYRTALGRAAEAIVSGTGAIVVVTDLQQAGWDAGGEGAVPDGIEVAVVEIAPPPGNVALTAVRREGNVVVAGVHNFGLSPVSVPVRLLVDDRELAQTTVDIAPQAAAEARLTASLPASGGAEVRIDDETGYRFDNSRFFVLDPPAAVSIVVITGDPPASSNVGLYVERALSVADEGRAFDVRVVDGRTFSTADPGEIGTPAALVLLGTRTLDRTGRERVRSFLRDGGRVLLTLGPDVDLGTLSDTVGKDIAVEAGDAADGSGQTVTLVAVDTRHPIFRPFLGPSGALGDVFVERYRRLKAEEGGAVLARFSAAGDALVEHAVDRGRLLVFASDLDNQWNRFPLSPSFVPWMIETARYLSQWRDQRQSFTLPDVPVGVPSVAGVHVVGDRTVAVNPDVRESNPAAATREAFLEGVTRVAATAGDRALALAREQEERQRLWQIGLLVMFAALAGEGLIGRRAV